MDVVAHNSHMRIGTTKAENRNQGEPLDLREACLSHVQSKQIVVHSRDVSFIGTLIDKRFGLYTFQALDRQTVHVIPKRDGTVWFKYAQESDRCAHCGHPGLLFEYLLHERGIVTSRSPSHPLAGANIHWIGAPEADINNTNMSSPETYVEVDSFQKQTPLSRLRWAAREGLL